MSINQMTKNIFGILHLTSNQSILPSTDVKVERDKKIEASSHDIQIVQVGSRLGGRGVIRRK